VLTVGQYRPGSSVLCCWSLYRTETCNTPLSMTTAVRRREEERVGSAATRPYTTKTERCPFINSVARFDTSPLGPDLFLDTAAISSKKPVESTLAVYAREIFHHEA